jgi:flagellar biosynthetic protein FlhB
MSEHTGEKTEQPTQRRLEDAFKRGQFAQSSEVQTAFVLLGGTLALMLFGRQAWQQMAGVFGSVLGHLHVISVSPEVMRGQFIRGLLVLSACVAPVVVAVMAGGLVAGGIQSRFQTTPEVTTPDWSRLNPVSGLQRIFSMRSLMPTVVGLIKLGVIVALSYRVVRQVFSDPIFYSAVDTGRVAQFLAESSLKIMLWIGLALALVAAADYAYQAWRTNRDLMMTKDELKEELKHSEGNPLVKAKQRRRRSAATFNKMLAAVPTADVIVKNPTRLAIALRYDRQTMRAPRIVAKGQRWNARRILEIAEQYQVPVIENKPLARLMFKYGKVGGEIPAQFYTAVAEILAWVYRTNRYRYYTEQNATN